MATLHGVRQDQVEFILDNLAKTACAGQNIQVEHEWLYGHDRNLSSHPADTVLHNAGSGLSACLPIVRPLKKKHDYPYQ